VYIQIFRKGYWCPRCGGQNTQSTVLGGVETWVCLDCEFEFDGCDRYDWPKLIDWEAIKNGKHET